MSADAPDVDADVELEPVAVRCDNRQLEDSTNGEARAVGKRDALVARRRPEGAGLVRGFDIEWLDVDAKGFNSHPDRRGRKTSSRERSRDLRPVDRGDHGLAEMALDLTRTRLILQKREH